MKTKIITKKYSIQFGFIGTNRVLISSLEVHYRVFEFLSAVCYIKIIFGKIIAIN